LEGYESADEEKKTLESRGPLVGLGVGACTLPRHVKAQFSPFSKACPLVGDLYYFEALLFRQSDESKRVLFGMCV
jgi:hypothetical protein